MLRTRFAKEIGASFNTLVVSDLNFAPVIRKQPPRTWLKYRRLFANSSRIIFKRRTDGYSLFEAEIRLKFAPKSLDRMGLRPSQFSSPVIHGQTWSYPC